MLPCTLTVLNILEIPLANAKYGLHFKESSIETILKPIRGHREYEQSIVYVYYVVNPNVFQANVTAGC